METPHKKDILSQAEFICDKYLNNACIKGDALSDDIGNTIGLQSTLEAAITTNRQLKAHTQKMFIEDAELNAQITLASKQCAQITHDCQRIRHELEVDQYLDRMITVLDNYGKSLRLLAYPYKHGPSQISELRRRFAQLLQVPKSTHSDTVVVCRKKGHK